MQKKLLLILALLVTPAVFAKNTTPLGFHSPEHVTIGENVMLQFPNSAPVNRVPLHLQNGLTLTYGEIVALSGDFYGLVDAPIALGKTREEQQQRFVNAYATLATEMKAVAESAMLLDLIRSEEKDVQQGLDQGENPETIYARVNTDYNIQWNCITGGLCAADYPGLPQDVLRKIYALKQGRYLKLADTDFDHFNVQAWQAYSTGHTVALEAALAAHRDNNISALENAYALNAFACHYLTDSFAPGHMRTPRLELYYTVFPPTVGSLLSGFMHTEDNTQGLIVSNRRGDTWKAYGDGYYADARNQKNRELLQEAMQTSADEIYTAFTTGKLPAEDKVHDLIPDLEKLSRPDTQHVNSSPLFYWDKDKKVVLRRKNLKDIHNHAWTAYWLGWETLIELMSINGIPGKEQAALLAHADTYSDAIKKGLIKDKDVLMFYQSHHF